MAATAAAAAEALPGGVAAGLEADTLVHVLATEFGSQLQLGVRGDKLLRREWGGGLPVLPMDVAAKGLGLLEELAAEVGLAPPPVAAAARATYGLARGMGLGGLDVGAAVQVWERRAAAGLGPAGGAAVLESLPQGLPTKVAAK